jgi:aminopeptidase N
MKSIYYCVVLVCFYIFCCCPVSASTTEIGSALKYIKQDFDVLKYDAYIKYLSVQDKSINAYCDIKFVWTTEKEDRIFYFHLRDLNIDSCFYNGKSIEVSKSSSDTLSDYYYSVNSQDKSDTVTLRVYYTGVMRSEGGNNDWGGVQYSSSCLYSMGVGFNCKYISCTRHWLPCYDLPCDKALFKCTFEVPLGYFAASNGLLNKSDTIEGYIKYTWEQKTPCATYLLCFAISDYSEKIHLINDMGMDIPLYCKVKDTSKVKYLFKLVPEMVKYYSSVFGQYPWEKVGYVMTPTGSMEHQTMISYDETLLANNYIKKDTANSVAAHELSHQWFGGYITPTDFRDTWLNEGFASYCESLWMEHLYGNKSYQNWQNNFISVYIKNIGTNEGIFPLYDYTRESPSSNYPTTIYYKGAAVLGMLRYQMGDSSFFHTLKEYLMRSKDVDTINTEYFKSICKLMNTNKNLDIDQFFKQWIYGKGYPLYLFTLSKKEGKLFINYKEIQDTSYGYFNNVPVEIVIRNSEGKNKSVIINTKAVEGDTLIDNININQVYFNYGDSVRTLMTAKIEFANDINEEDTTNDVLVIIQPNPADDYVIIKLADQIQSPVLNIYDICGKKIIDAMTPNYNGSSFAFSSEALGSGMYYAELKNGYKTYFKRFYIKH